MNHSRAAGDILFQTASYILDWIAHHLSMGVEDVFLYSNDNTDGSDRLLDILNQHGVIRLYKNQVGSGVGPQLKAYAHALQFVPDILDFEWTALLDVDEYLMVNSSLHPDIIAYLDWAEQFNADSIALSWTMQGPNGIHRWSDVPLVERFPTRDNPDRHVKSVFRPQRFSHAHPHFPNDDARQPRKYVTSDGKPFKAWPFNEEPTCERAWNAHFYYKSAEEFLVRRLRNRADVGVSEKFNEQLISSPLANLYVAMFHVSKRWAPGVSEDVVVGARAAKRSLLSLPGVAEAEDICKSLYAEEVDHVRELLAQSARFQTPNTQEARLFELAFGSIR